MSLYRRCQRVMSRPLTSVLAASMLLAFSAFLLTLHVRAIRDVRDIGIPAAGRLTQLEKRLATLKAQLEAADVQTVLSSGSADEYVRVYALPQGADLDRLLAFFDVSRDALAARGVTSFSAIQVGGPQALPLTSSGANAVLSAYPLHVSVVATQQGAQSLMALLRLAGCLTVSDVLTPVQRSQLVALTEQENPAGITVLEQFLDADLLHYALDPTLYENQVLKSLTSASFTAAFRALVDGSDLQEARTLLGGAFGRTLEQQHLWPVRLLSVDDVSMTPLDAMHFTVSLRLQAYSRSPDGR
jgi:hypothetical protein